MDDLISRQAAKDAFMKATGDGDKVEFCWWVLDSVPIVNPAENGGCWGCQCAMLGQAPVKRGKWNETGDRGGRNYACGCCRFTFIVDTCMGEPMWNYCPNCGVRIRGTNDE